MGRIVYKEGEIIGSCKLIKMLPSKIFGTQGRRVGMGLFQCSVCGKPFECMISSVKVSTKSCGCFAKEIASKRHTKHGLTHTKEYRTWLGIKTRCYNKKDESYKHWGGRGIRMYSRWLNSFETFLKYVGVAPNKNLSLDRINNDGNYEPGNVRWATSKQQSNNKRDSRIIEYKGKRQTIMEWSTETNINYSVIQGRLNRGWSAEDIFNKPVSLSGIIRHGRNNIKL